jgi:hypothetical protein
MTTRWTVSYYPTQGRGPLEQQVTLAEVKALFRAVRHKWGVVCRG